MTSKPDEIANNATVAPAVETLPSVAGSISALASANAPFVFFDEVPFVAHHQGMGALTLTAARWMAAVPDKGVVTDHAVVCQLRASLPALISLRNAINQLLKIAEDQAEKPTAASAPPSSAIN